MGIVGLTNAEFQAMEDEIDSLKASNASLFKALRNLARSYESIVRGEMGSLNERAYPEWVEANKVLSQEDSKL